MVDNSLEGLEKAKIVEMQANGTGFEEKTGGITINCMFNPYEYTISKSVTYKERAKTESDNPQEDFAQPSPQTLKLSLIFDTYEAGEDVSLQTRQLWLLMGSKTREKSSKHEKLDPPYVAFIWGVFRFVARLTSMTQKFTLFKRDGTPVRAKVDVTLTQYEDEDDYRAINTNPTSGGGERERLWRVNAGDRLDTIAAIVFRDATEWRRIADHNKIRDPLSIRPGQILRIPLA